MGRRATSRQDGFTLVELLMVILLLGIIGAASLATFMRGSDALGRVDDDIQGQQDLKIVTENLTRDIRAGRGVDGSSGPDYLSVWVDYDADYIKDTGTEVIVWEVVGPTAAGKFDVTRKVGSATAQVVGRSVIDAFAFKYFVNSAGALVERVPADSDPATVDTALTTAHIVEVSMDYDAVIGAYLQQKTNTYQVRLRNTE